MALFSNFGVNRRNRLCGVHEYASAQFLDFLELAENCSFLDRKLISALNETVDGHYLTAAAPRIRENARRLAEILTIDPEVSCGHQSTD